MITNKISDDVYEVLIYDWVISDEYLCGSNLNKGVKL